jgi:hypothetical protein
MNMIPMGEYYVWFCERCDSTNQTHWSRTHRHDLTCAACHAPQSRPDAERRAA